MREDLPFTARIVMHLVSEMLQNTSVTGYHLYTDRYYTSYVLATELLKLNVHLTGTVVGDRSVGIVRNILRNDREIMLVLMPFSDIQSLYMYTLQSSKIDVFSSKVAKAHFPLYHSRFLCVCLPLDSSRFAVNPLLHKPD